MLADLEIEPLPSVNDLATILAHAMTRPLINEQHRPRRIDVRRNPTWKPIFPALNKLGIEVEIKSDLQIVEQAFAEFLAVRKESQSTGAAQLTGDKANIETLYPAIAKWVDGWGHVEIGDQKGFGFIVRTIDYGGVVFEDDTPSTLADAMTLLDKAMRKYFKQEGIEIT